MNPSKKKNLSVDVGLIPSLGRNSIKDHTTAILELIKNSYDAGANIVDVEIMSHSAEPFIRIADNGCGMTEDDIDRSWLRICRNQVRPKELGNRWRRNSRWQNASS